MILKQKSGLPRREFLYSEDACVFLLDTHINIGTGVDISIKELAQLIKSIIGFEGELTFNTEKPDGTMVKLTDPSKLHSLGWKHKVELEDGIRTMYAWYLNSSEIS